MELSKKQQIIFIIIFAVLCALAVGIASLFNSKGKSKLEGYTIMVHVKGEVKRPGVYTLKADNRVKDAVAAAGGETENAELSGINLAAFLKDGQELKIPSKKGDASANTNEATQITKEPKNPPPEGTKININNATVEQLDALPDVGMTTAERIVQYRQKNGPFKKPEDLMKVSGIGPKTYERLASYIEV